MSYYSLILLQRDLLENQVFEEILRERSTYFFQQKKPRNFWIVLSPFLLSQSSWVNKYRETQFFQTNHLDNDFFLSIVSSDKDFINWLGLRLGYFESLENNIQQTKKDYVSNGIKASFVEEKKTPLLEGHVNSLDPEILLKKEKKFLLFLKQEQQVFFEEKKLVAAFF
jgi:hypothetical protein